MRSSSVRSPALQFAGSPVTPFRLSLVLYLWLGGLWMWWIPFIAKRRRRAATSTLLRKTT
jgi:hypothetical protein